MEVDSRPFGAPVWSELDVLIAPSRTEGWPFAHLEALMHGVSVLCTPVGGVCEFDKFGATLIDEWNASDAVDMLDKMRLAGPPPIAFDDWRRRFDQMISEHVSVFDAVLAELEKS